MLIYAKKDKGKYTWNRKPKVTYEEEDAVPIAEKPRVYPKKTYKDAVPIAEKPRGKLIK